MNLRDLAIINALPYSYDDILTVGCGKCRLEEFLVSEGVDVLATDFAPQMVSVPFKTMDIYSPNVQKRDVVICSEVLEHLENYKDAYKNLIKLAKKRVIITVPHSASFFDKGHINFWGDKSIDWVYDCEYAVSVGKIRSKVLDIEAGQWSFLIIVDKENYA